MTPTVPGPNDVECPSGNYVNMLTPDPDTILVEDIAHKLAQCNRWAGSGKYPISVAQHAVFVSQRVAQMGGSLEAQLFGLKHDDSEAFLQDIPRPLKPLLGEQYKILTENLDEAIWEAHHAQYGSNFYDKEIKAADRFALIVEARHVMPSQGRTWDKQALEWDLLGLPSRIVTPDYWLGEVAWRQARDTYLIRHRYLEEALNARHDSAD